MKILIFNTSSIATLGSSYARAFTALGHQVKQFNPMDVLNSNFLYRNKYSKRLLERIILAQCTADILDRILDFKADMLWVTKGQWALPELWQQYKAIQPWTTLVCYNPDDPVVTYSRGGNAPWIKKSISCYDLYCTFKSDIVSDLKHFGAKKVAVIPFAWDPNILPRAQTTDIKYDLLFLANGDSERTKIMIDIISDPLTKNWNIGIFGHWKKSGHKRLDSIIKPMPYKQDQISEAMANAVVSLNILRKQNITSHNLRSFEIPGAGGLSLSQFTEELGAIFPKDKAALYFDTPSDAVTQILHMKKHPDIRHRLIQNAGTIVREHTFEHRAADLLDKIPAFGKPH